MGVSEPKDVWLPSKLTLYLGKHKRALMVIKANVPVEAGSTVLLLAKRPGDNPVLQFLGVVSKARKNYLEIRLLWDTAVSLAVYVGKKFDPHKPVEGGKIVIYDYLVRIENWRPPLRQ